jgi:hypothetical protein
MDKLILDEPNLKRIAHGRLVGLAQSLPKLSPISPTMLTDKRVLSFEPLLVLQDGALISMFCAGFMIL